MAGDWIKVRSNIKDDPDVVLMAGSLGMDEFAVVGRLHAVWAWLDQHSTTGTNVRITSAYLDRLTACPGFADAMRAVEWLRGRDGDLEFPDFDKHNGDPAKARASDTKRKRESRSSDASRTSVRNNPETQPDKCPGISGPEKRREEESKNPPNPQGGDGETNLFGETDSQPKDRCLPANWSKLTKADQRKSKVLRNSPAMIQIGSWFGRKPDTLWTIAEAASLMMLRPSPQEVDGMGVYYSAEIPSDDIRRRDLGTLLNNWSGELDRARKFVSSLDS